MIKGQDYNIKDGVNLAEDETKLNIFFDIKLPYRGQVQSNNNYGPNPFVYVQNIPIYLE